jgi:hypothetical protein
MWGRLKTCGRLAIGLCDPLSLNALNQLWFTRARPRKCFGCCDQAGLDRVQFDVRDDSSKLRFVTHQVIVTFLLPERLSSEDKNLIGFPAGLPLE